MPRCPHCETDHDVDALVSHRRRDVLVVHCPECERRLGTYREP